MRTLYFDCFAGASGNMILGALSAIGMDETEFRRQIGLLGISNYEIEFTKVDRSGISSIHADISVPSEQVHRHLADIEKIINDSALSDKVKQNSTAIFKRLAEAEAKVHGIDLEAVHFHEVGAMDAIIDVVGACIGFDMLGIEKFVCSKIHVGSGFVNMVHGKFPVPPPAVTELLRDILIYSTEIDGELITPTGAAIISTVCDSYGQIPEMSVKQSGYGAGTRTYEKFPNVLRLMIGETKGSFGIEVNTDPKPKTEALTLLETNIDDLSPQILGFVMERAFELGALDCWFTSIQMKKNRPATMLSILCTSEKRKIFTELIYSETTTLGIRVRPVERESLEREVIEVITEYGPVDVKIARIGAKIVNAMPEYEQVKKIAKENGVSFRIVRDLVLAKLDGLSMAATP
ncbi:MAG: nickel pincer cofactor biosynthesis protein LarC [Saprospiraceae bacterium]|nr:nickel pincer cofactor biosynthesis protein LarC [Pyrinomonadaceae bacterium]